MDDPLEELNEVYQDVKEIEYNFKKVLEICCKFIHHKHIGYLLYHFYSFSN
jgi:hypothetical protein